MSTAEDQLKKEIRNNQNLHKMNQSLTLENESYAAALTLIRIFLEGDNSVDDSQLVPPEDAESLVKEAIRKWESVPACECERWKRLYTEATEESYRLSTKNDQLLQKISGMEKQTELDRIQLKDILESYLKMYRQVHQPESETIILEPKKVKQNRSLSKNKPPSSASKNQKKSPDAKNQKNQSNVLLDCLQKDVSTLTKELKQSRKNQIDLQRLIKQYRMNERRRILQELR